MAGLSWHRFAEGFLFRLQAHRWKLLTIRIQIRADERMPISYSVGSIPPKDWFCRKLRNKTVDGCTGRELATNIF